MKAWKTPIKAIIFDNDGLLLDTEGLYAIAHHELTGEPLQWDLKTKLMGLNGTDACTIIVNHYKLNETPKQYLERRNKRLVQLFPTAKFMPGALDLFKQFKSMGLKIGLATSSERDNYQVKITNHHDFYSQFDAVTCGDEVSHGKPHPEIYLATMKKLGIENPAECLVFEDSPNGVKSANNAGMAVVQVPDPELPESANIEAQCKPDLILDSLEKFSTDYFDWAV